MSESVALGFSFVHFVMEKIWMCVLRNYFHFWEQWDSLWEGIFKSVGLDLIQNLLFNCFWCAVKLLVFTILISGRKFCSQNLWFRISEGSLWEWWPGALAWSFGPKLELCSMTKWNLIGNFRTDLQGQDMDGWSVTKQMIVYKGKLLKKPSIKNWSLSCTWLSNIAFHLQPI